ncbi:unnamed protein product [Clavelina lepadiformis]|uniref:Uncharacterized protein n=1 Tax=Clavelina lepadiformis TaxID=159417 RepID=A0ABP0FI31_CLALP
MTGHPKTITTPQNPINGDPTFFYNKKRIRTSDEQAARREVQGHNELGLLLLCDVGCTWDIYRTA